MNDVTNLQLQAASASAPQSRQWQQQSLMQRRTRGTRGWRRAKGSQTGVMMKKRREWGLPLQFAWFDEDASVVEAGIGKRRSAAQATQRVAAWSRAGLL